jgi:hypothetical protein
VRKGLAFVLGCTKAKEFAPAHWLVNGADGGRLFVRYFGGDGIVREDAAGDVPASLTTMVWNAPSKSWTGCAPGSWPKDVAPRTPCCSLARPAQGPERDQRAHLRGLQPPRPAVRQAVVGRHRSEVE